MSMLVSAEEDLESERVWEREKRGRRLTACSNKGESATCTSAAHNAPLNSSRSVRASLPFSHSLLPRSPRNRLLSPLSYSLLDTDSLRFADVVHRGGYIWAECLVARCVPREIYHLFFPVLYVFPLVVQLVCFRRRAFYAKLSCVFFSFDSGQCKW